MLADGGVVKGIPFRGSVRARVHASAHPLFGVPHVQHRSHSTKQMLLTGPAGKQVAARYWARQEPGRGSAGMMSEHIANSGLNARPGCAHVRTI